MKENKIQFTTSQVAEVSTGHLTPQDLEKVGQVEKEISGLLFNREEGFMIAVYQDLNLFRDQVVNLQELGFSRALIDLLTEARRQKIDYILFDRDNPTVEGLETFFHN